MEIIKQKEQIKPGFLDKDAPTDAYTYVPEKPEPTLAQYITELLSKRELCVSAALCDFKVEGKDGRIDCVKRKTCKNKGCATVAQVCRKAGIDSAYGNQIFNDRVTNPHRDYVICLAFGFEMDFDETQELLRIAEKNRLCEKDIPRERVIAHALACDYNLGSVAATLEDLNLQMLEPMLNAERRAKEQEEKEQKEREQKEQKQLAGNNG